jgi:lipopolysaccharide export system permease protein
LTTSIFVFFVNERLTPVAQRKNQDIKRSYFSKEKSKNIKNLAFLGENNKLYFFQNFYPEEERVEGITILEHNEDLDLMAKIVAERGVWQKKFWIFYKSWRYNFSEDGKIKGTPVYFDEEISDIKESPQDLLKQRISPELMSIKDLTSYIGRLEEAKAETVVRYFKCDLHQKISSPFTSLVIILAGIPFALSVRKKRIEFFSFGICIILCFFYYVIWSICVNLGKIGFFPPFLSAWLTHLLFLLIGIYLSFFYRVS